MKTPATHQSDAQRDASLLKTFRASRKPLRRFERRLQRSVRLIQTALRRMDGRLVRFGARGKPVTLRPEVELRIKWREGSETVIRIDPSHKGEPLRKVE